MHLDQNQLNKLCDIAKTAAIEASKVIQTYVGKDIEFIEKDNGTNLANSIVTLVDLKSQETILKILESTLLEYDLGMLAEEENDDHSRFEKDHFWCIDPLDGTLNFSQTKKGYSVSIALVTKEGEAILGVVIDPITNNIYHAIKGMGAYKNNQNLKIKRNSEIVTILTDQSKEIIELKGSKVLAFQGAVMNAINTVEMAPAIYYKLPKKEIGGGSLWDFAATSVIQSEAGGINSDYFNNKLKLNSKNTFMNQDGIIFASSNELIKQYLPKL
jgi:3'-phosphoadenosine 5'-phosphosulfate (PAPS) 3'-phosphatase